MSRRRAASLLLLSCCGPLPLVDTGRSSAAAASRGGTALPASPPPHWPQEGHAVTASRTHDEGGEQGAGLAATAAQGTARASRAWRGRAGSRARRAGGDGRATTAARRRRRASRSKALIILADTDTYVQDTAGLTGTAASWNSKPSNWVDNDPCGDKWVGIICTQDRVTSIPSSFGLSGSLSGDIQSLPELQYLDLSYNKDLGGSLPSSIGSLRNLQNLILVGCSFLSFIFFLPFFQFFRFLSC